MPDQVRHDVCATFYERVKSKSTQEPDEPKNGSGPKGLKFKAQ